MESAGGSDPSGPREVRVAALGVVSTATDYGEAASRQGDGAWNLGITRQSVGS
jgi:hypothetical protein